jgi:enterochelin esterase-like enzyme
MYCVKRPLSVLIALAALAGAGTAAGGSESARELDASFRSAALGGALRFRVYLPARYYGSTQRYPVLYFLHGLPAAPDGYRGIGYLERALDRLDRPAILVAPQGASKRQPDGEYLGRWEQAIAHELPRAVDRDFRTIGSRNGRALLGVSAGGYGAMMLALHDLADFAVVESWSGYFHATDPSGTETRDLASASANARASAHTYVPALRRLLAEKPTLIAFYVGDGDRRFLSENLRLDRELTEAGVSHVFRIYSGGHSQTLWAQHASGWLSLALDRLASPQ